ncbi:acyltransferase family protein [Pedobacter sp. LMG 31464]|uniref:Acyltransferase family protein n=1 Tax=Pedobacter planticolens TaxID=2679964 RepID=A0A923DUH4_9SPHI|nr:acyltransferase [Pedobacter planticolens]MBB2144092.1 acyltransferase family protein [Pedobacter planticolens]
MKDSLKALDGLRGLSALYVLIHHARLALTQSYQSGLVMHPEKYEWYDKLLVYFFGLFKFGHEAVIIFFVLSGFVIHLKQASSNYDFENFKIIAYLKKRIIRIYPTLLVSFLLCLLIDFLIYKFIPDNLGIFSKYTFSSFLYNLFLIPDAPIWGNNFPVWSLKHEWFFYMMYPLLLWLANKSSFLPFIVSIGLYFSYFLGFSIPYIGTAAYTLTVWSLGSLLAVAYKNSYALLKYIPYLLLLCFLYPFVKRTESNFPVLDLCFGLITTGFIALIVLEKISIINSLLIQMTWIGTFSYSLYLFHTPFLSLFKAIIVNSESNHDIPYHLWYVILAILVITPIIYLIYCFTERVAINYKKTI